MKIRVVRVLLASLLVAATATAQRTPDEALAALRAGNQRFVDEQSVPQPLGDGSRRSLAHGQSPYAIVVCCADSRVPPEHVFNAGLGELFVVRVAGNACDADTLASIEYAAEHLSTPLCVVLGHESCGAVAASIAAAQGKAAPESEALATLLAHLQPAVRVGLAENLGGKELSQRVEEENAQATALDCLRRSPVLQLLRNQKRFRILPARYHLDSGAVEWLPERPLLAEARDVETRQNGQPHATGLPPHVAMQMLSAGHRRFLSSGKPLGDISKQRRQDLTQGQHPFAIVLTCSDSRVPPEHIFDVGLGELFVIRVAGNVLSDEVLASIEYAAAHTGASLLLVMGHTGCGAVTAAAESHDDAHLTASMRDLMDRLLPAVELARRGPGSSGDALIAEAVRCNVLRTMQLAHSRSSILRSLEQEGRFAMVPAVYDLATGNIEWLKDAANPGTSAAMPPAAPIGETASPSHAAEPHAAQESPRPDEGHHAEPAAPTGEHAAAGQDAPATEVPNLDLWGHSELLPSTHGQTDAGPGTPRPADGTHDQLQPETRPAPDSALQYWLRRPEVGLGCGVLGMTTLLLAALMVMNRRN